MVLKLDSKIPDGPLEEKWDEHKSSIRSLLTLNFQTFEEPQLLAG